MKCVRCAVLALMLMPSVGVAQNFEAGLSAAKAGDYATALQQWRPLAEQGNATAQFNLGGMYYAGRGVPQDYAEAVSLYRMAAEQGDATAQFTLAVMYGNGHGVPQDNMMAHMWFNIAASNGINGAAENRDIAASRMTLSDVSEAQRRARLCVTSGYQECD